MGYDITAKELNDIEAADLFSSQNNDIFLRHKELGLFIPEAKCYLVAQAKHRAELTRLALNTKMVIE